MLLVAVQFALPNTTSPYALGQFLTLLQGWLEIDPSVMGWYTQVYDAATGASLGFNFNWYIVSYTGSYTTGSRRQLLTAAQLLSLKDTMNAVVAAKLSDGSLTQAIQQRGISQAVGFSDTAALVNAASAVPVAVAEVPTTSPTTTASLSPTSTRTPTPSNTRPPPAAPASSSTNNTGAIVGGVVGGAAGLAILAALIYYTRAATPGGPGEVAKPVYDPYADSLLNLETPANSSAAAAKDSVGGARPYLTADSLAGVSIRDVQPALPPPSTRPASPLDVANKPK